MSMALWAQKETDPNVCFVKAYQDTYVQGKDDPFTDAGNFGSRDRIVVKSQFIREALFMWDVQEIKDTLLTKYPSDYGVIKAEVSLFVRTGNVTANLYDLYIRKAASDWDELLVTWGTRPAVEDPILDKQKGSTVANTNILFDVTKTIQNAISGGEDLISFNLSQEIPADVTDETYDIQFHSLQYQYEIHHPRLRITVGAMSSIEDNAADNSNISIYPSSLNQGDILNVYGIEGDAALKVVDLYGRIALSTSGVSVDTSTLTPGIYLLQAEVQGRLKKPAKFIVK
ncbi:MAG: DNRLRE domain-containing protein [Dysgonomonas sp.]